MRKSIWAAIVLTTAAAWPIAAQAGTFYVNLSGAGVSGALYITYDVDTNIGPIGTVPNTHDPEGSSIITGISGTYSDAAAGIVNATITGLRGLNVVSPEPGNTFAPSRFSLLPVASGVPIAGAPPGVTSPGYHYDNILYTSGLAPRTAFDYPATGGIFDIYGVAFALDNGDLVNVWSNGTFDPSVPFDYGSATTDGRTVLSYNGGLAISPAPEPASWAMMVAGFGLAGTALRRRKVAVRFA